MLKEGRDPAQASEAVSQGDAIENWAEREEIEDIKVGDWALSRDEDAFVGATHVSAARATKSLCFGYVSETYQNTTNELVCLTLFDSQTGATETLEVTTGHPFWVSETATSSREGGTWTFAGELAQGDELTSATGHALTVTAVKHTQRHATTFNFAVSHAHTYFVGITSTWAHNTSGRHGGPATRALNQSIADEYGERGWKLVRGAGVGGGEEYIPSPAGGKKGSVFVDLTFEKQTKSGRNVTLRVQTVDTAVSGRLTPREAEAAAAIMTRKPGDKLVTIPKSPALRRNYSKAHGEAKAGRSGKCS